MKSIKINSLILAFIAALSVILLSTTALAQTDISINNSNIIRFGGDVIVPPQQIVENAHAIGGDVTIQEGARVTQTAIAIDGDVILEEGARVDGVTVVLGTLGVALWVGQRASSSVERSPMQQFFTGVLILTLIGLIPILGGLVLSVVNIFGFGALLLWLVSKRRLQAI